MRSVRRIVITGASSGLGRAAALALGAGACELVLLSRDRAAGERVAKAINRRRGAVDARFIATDLAAPASMCAAVAAISAQWDRVDVLVNNAGARFDRFATNADGIELTFATNHLGHFLLTSLLLDRLRAAPSARVITVASVAHLQATRPEHWSVAADAFDRRMAYARAKLANLLFAGELARRLHDTPVTSHAIDPGMVATAFGRNNGWIPWLKHRLYHGLRREIVRPEHAARTLVHVATAPQLTPPNGGYFRGDRPAPVSPLAADRALASDLWRVSVALTSLGPAVGPSWPWLAP